MPTEYDSRETWRDKYYKARAEIERLNAENTRLKLRIEEEAKHHTLEVHLLHQEINSLADENDDLRRELELDQ